MSDAGRIACFDLGGVLVRICRTWEEACARAGVEVRQMDRFREPALSARRKDIHDRYQRGEIGCEEHFTELTRATGGLYSAEEVRAVHDAWTLEDYPGVSALIDGLHGLGWRTACLSNTNASHWRILTQGDGASRPRSEALAKVQTPMASHLLGASKPDEAIYAKAERGLEAGAAWIVFFDDLEPNVLAARRRGWAAHLIDPMGDPASQVRAALGVPSARNA